MVTELTKKDLSVIPRGIFERFPTYKIIQIILKNQAIVNDIRKCTKSDIQNGKKTITLARLQTLVRGIDV